MDMKKIAKKYIERSVSIIARAEEEHTKIHIKDKTTCDANCKYANNLNQAVEVLEHTKKMYGV